MATNGAVVVNIPHGENPNQSWETFAVRNLLCPLCAQLVLLLVLAPFSHIWNLRRWYEIEWIHTFIGTEWFPPVHPGPYAGLKMMQLICSTLTLILWVIETYRQAKDFLYVECATLPVYVFAYIVEMMKFGLSPRDSLAASNFIDVFTVFPTLAFVFYGDEKQWLSLSFLRVYTAVDTFKDVETSGFRIPLSDFSREVVLLSLRSLSMVIMLSGTILTLEILGELPFLEDKFIETEMGGLSFVQMVYWIFTTVSTVGYGDFSPTTILSRLFCCAAIVVGVVFFGSETGKLVELQNQMSSGRGAFTPYKRRKHVVIVGGGVQKPGQILYSLLDELFTSEEEEHWPNVIFMSLREAHDRERNDLGLRHHCAAELPPHIQSYLFFLHGSPMRLEDLGRAAVGQASAVFVIADATAKDWEKEDGQNFLRCLSIKKHYPQAPLRLMLLQEETRQWAINSGIPKDHCFSMQEMKALCMAHGTYCHGFITMISNLLVSDDVPNSEMGKLPWMQEYCNASNNTFYGMVLPANFAGMSWSQVVWQIFDQSGAIAFAAQIDGRVVLNPGRISRKPVQGGEVIFVIAYEPDVVVKSEGKDQSDWILSFTHAWSIASNQERFHPTPSEGPKTPTEVMSPRSLTAIFPKMVDELSEKDNHVVIISCSPGETNWAQIGMVLKAMRSPGREWQHRPIVVLSNYSPPASFAAVDYYSVIFVTGNAMKSECLLRAQAHTASDIVLLSDNMSGCIIVDEFQDQHVVLITNAVEAFLRSWSREVCVLVDLFHAESVTFLKEVGLNDKPSRKTQMHVDKDIRSTSLTWKKQMNLWKDSVRVQTRFACGQLFTLNFMGAMLGRQYYVPSTLEVVSSLITCSGQLSLPWLVPTPKEFAGKEYKQLVKAWVEAPDMVIPLGIHRHLDDKRRDGEAKGLGYVITNPIGDLTLNASDRIYVLASPEFGKRMLSCEFDGAASNGELTRADTVVSIPDVFKDLSRLDLITMKNADVKELATKLADVNALLSRARVVCETTI